MSEELLRFIVSGEPVGKGRPIASTQGGFARMRTPKKTLEYEAHVRRSALDAWGEREPIDFPVLVILHVYRGRPKTIARRKPPPGVLWASGGRRLPDLDNIIKAVLDGLQLAPFQKGWPPVGVLVDDRLVVGIDARAYYHAIGGAPRVEVTLIRAPEMPNER